MVKVVIDLFSGLGGFSAAFQDADDWEVVTVDLDPDDRFDPDIKVDVMELRPSDLLNAIGLDREEIDLLVVLIGHPCTLFSTAGNHDEWDMEEREPVGKRAREHVAMLFHTIGLVRAISPDYWYLENPRGSRIRWLIGPPDEWVTYCQYGTEYQKSTGLWGHHALMDFKRCYAGDNCHKANTEHDGRSAINSMSSDHAERSKVPYKLSKAILEACNGNFELIDKNAMEW